MAADAGGCRSWVASGRDPESVLLRLREKYPKLTIQMVSFANVPNASMVSMVAAQTSRAARTDALLAQRAEMDILLRLAGTKQIGTALQRIGYKSKGKKIILVVIGPEAELSRLEEAVKRERTDRLHPIPSRPLSRADFELIERAALLASATP